MHLKADARAYVDKDWNVAMRVNFGAMPRFAIVSLHVLSHARKVGLTVVMDVPKSVPILAVIASFLSTMSPYLVDTSSLSYLVGNPKISTRRNFDAQSELLEN